MSATTAAQAIRRGISQVITTALGAFRTMLGYLTFTATLLTALTLVVRRDFSNAVLSVVEDWLSQLGQVADVVDRIVVAWHEIAVVPLAAYLGDWLDWHPSLLVVEVATLVLFAIGPFLRAVWTAQTIRSSIRKRLRWVVELQSAKETQSAAISELKSIQDELQASYDDRNWTRAKKVGKAVGGLALAGLSLLAGGANVRFVQPLAKSAWDSLSSWDEVRDRIIELGKDVEMLEKEQARIERQIEALSARDNHLIGRLVTVSAEAAAAQIRDHVAHKMRLAVALSRFALGVVMAVVLAYVVEWTWPGL
ncbi:hypothetical protein [Maricaulis maris]|uniref:Uncharacterized protein n=1 Tax=Maricaulis maris TaxID=74318 RepID=A0A495DLR4_9PROT|nr:hypothetical protein [Maricaulis maris]RKR03863.1 hypothetical protein C7435_0306 [Maricaulis maris]